jgi:2-polyprenyl-3-methyl-5-hydroxy-6-metoxy-1,4-benzoquinol methylase
MQTIQYHSCPLCGSYDIEKALATRDHSISGEAFDLYDCHGCSLRFTQNVPEPERIGEYYQSENYISHSDTKKGLINRLYHAARSYMLRSKQRLVQSLSARKRLLDVGCGTGYFMQHMRKQGYEVLGVEVDAGARNFGIQHFGLDVRPPAELEAGTLPGKFGIISMWHVLEHVYDPKLYLRRLHALLEDEGVLMIAVPNYQSLDGQKYQSHWAAYDVPRHLWHFSPLTLHNLATEMGFQILHKKGMPLDPFYVSLLSEKYQGKGLLAIPLGAWSGLRSLLNSWRRPERASSIIYVLKKVSHA